MSSLSLLSQQIRDCRLCADQMARPPHPVFQVSSKARILLASQAPGNLASCSGRPFTDPSGKRLRDWLGMDPHSFYDPDLIAIVPMGFCFPGYDRFGADRPPMRICADTWRARILKQLSRIELTLLVGHYAQAWHLRAGKPASVTETVRNWRLFLKRGIIPLPHPSWRNTAWLRKNPWFEREVLPELKQRVQDAVRQS